MNIETIKVKDYYKNESNIEIKVFMYSLVVGSLLVWLMILMIFLKKDLYYQNSLIINSNQNAMINVLLDDLSIIKNNNYLIIDNKKYYYDVLDIKLVDNLNLYYRVNLNLNSDLLVNSINSCKILVRKESLFNYIVRIVKGG